MTSFSWTPKTFNEVVVHVKSANSQLLLMMKEALRQMGHLNCPAPPWDLDGLYRVVAGAGDTLLIERFDHPTDRWVAAQLHAKADLKPQDADMPKATTLDARDPRRVFVIYGRDSDGYNALHGFLQAMDLDPKGFEAVANELGGSPFIGDVVREGMKKATAVIALVTPDELANLHPNLRGAHDKPEEKWRWQARPNVIFEAGMAFGIDERRTILVVLGSDAQLFSDVGGRHLVHLNNTKEKRTVLRDKLDALNCAVGPGSRWLDPKTGGDFDSAIAKREPAADVLENPRNPP